MYEFIEGLGLDLSTKVSSSYLEIIYDCIIQLSMAMDYAHKNGLVHGNLNLANVLLSRDGDTNVYKVTDFKPVSSMALPLSAEGQEWPFARQKKKISENEKIEILMLKDIYAVGICILELMIGRQSEKAFSISLDSMPLTWAQYPESTPLIMVLAECINLDNIS